MNDDYLFLENLCLLIRQGYSSEETLLICQNIVNHPSINQMLELLYEGHRFQDVIQDKHLPKDFIEFYSFFKERLSLADAIEHALIISKKIAETKKQVISKLTYPLVLLVFLVMFALFSVFILFPKVESLFTSFSMHPPLIFTILFQVMKMIPICIILLIVFLIILIGQLIYAIKRKKYLIIERYLKIPLVKGWIQKYFTLKFTLYFNELLKDHLDSHTIIQLLNEKMIESDIKIVLYEIYCKMQEGETFEEIVNKFEYFDPLFVTMYKTYLQSPNTIKDLTSYIQFTISKIDRTINKGLKYFIPIVYGFVAFFVISVYIAIIIPMMNMLGEI